MNKIKTYCMYSGMFRNIRINRLQHRQRPYQRRNILHRKMEEAGLEINDQSDEAPEDLGMSEVRVAFDEGKYQIEFYTFDKEEDAKSMYNYVQENLEKQYESESGRVRTSKSVGNHASYKLSADEKYFVVSRIGNTLVYSAATSDYKNQVKELVEDIGY